MSFQLNFLLQKAASYLIEHNFESASLMLRQAHKLNSNHPEVLRLSAMLAAKAGRETEGLELIEKALQVDRRNGILHSNKGNILLQLNRVDDAISSYKRAIEYSPKYAEAYGNLGNAYQEIGDYEAAQSIYSRAISIDPRNPDFYCHLGNAILASGNVQKAEDAYSSAIELDPKHIDAHYYLALARLSHFDFDRGWLGNEWRWSSNGFDSTRIRTTKKEWDGGRIDGRLLIWGEQGIGDQILYASMLTDIVNLVSSVTISVDEKLIPIFKRSFPNFDIVNKKSQLSDEHFEAQISIGSLGKLFRKDTKDFARVNFPYLVSDTELTDSYKKQELFSKKIACGISWKSSNRVHGRNKSMKLEDFSPLLALSENLNFLNLQYGNTNSEVEIFFNKTGIKLQEIPKIDLFNDLNSTLSAIDACEIIITTSNSTAHMAGALGKETLLLLPFSAGKFWYWHDMSGVSLWYPSIKVFKQEKHGDWSSPVKAVKAYLENRFEI